jgi:hypothetical protein
MLRHYHRSVVVTLDTMGLRRIWDNRWEIVRHRKTVVRGRTILLPLAAEKLTSLYG